MSDPYATPKAQGPASPPKRSRRRLWKHACIFLVIFLILNFDRFFGSAARAADVPEVSIAASLITLLLFYGAGYLLFSRVRSQR